MARTNWKKQAEEYEKQRNKLVTDLVEMALEFRKLDQALSVHTSGLNNYITVKTMSDIIMDKFTEGKDEVSETEEKD